MIGGDEYWNSCETSMINNKCTINDPNPSFENGPNATCGFNNLTLGKYEWKDENFYVDQVYCDGNLCDLSNWNGGKDCYKDGKCSNGCCGD